MNRSIFFIYTNKVAVAVAAAAFLFIQIIAATSVPIPLTFNENVKSLGFGVILAKTLNSYSNNVNHPKSGNSMAFFVVVVVVFVISYRIMLEMINKMYKMEIQMDKQMEYR